MFTVINSSRLNVALSHARTYTRHSGASDNMYHWRCMLSLFIYSSAVFVIVGGQSTIDDPDNDSELTDIVAFVRAELAKLVARNDILEAKNDRLEEKVAKLEAEQRVDCKSLVFRSLKTNCWVMRQKYTKLFSFQSRNRLS